MKLCFAQKKPSTPEKRIVFMAIEPLYIGFSLASLLVPFGAPLDAMTANGFLRLLYRTVKMTCSDTAALLVAHRIDWQQLGIVVSIAAFLFVTSFDKGLRCIEIGIVASIERMPHSCLTVISLCRTRGGNEYGEQQYDGSKWQTICGRRPIV